MLYFKILIYFALKTVETKMLRRDLIKYKGGDLLPEIGKGTYVLMFFLEQDKDVLVGRGGLTFPLLFRTGWYAYEGSAFGLGGIKR